MGKGWWIMQTWMSLTVEVLQARFREAVVKVGFQLKAMADHCNLSTRQLERIFTQRLGAKARDWILEVRMALAMELLRTKNLIKEVAAELNYRSVSAFTRAFKKQHGFTPSAYQASLLTR